MTCSVLILLLATISGFMTNWLLFLQILLFTLFNVFSVKRSLHFIGCGAEKSFRHYGDSYFAFTSGSSGLGLGYFSG